MAQLCQTGSQTGLTVESTDAVSECRWRVSMLQRESLDVRAGFLGLKVCPHCHLSFTLSPRGEGTWDGPVIGGQEEAMLLRWGCSRLCGFHRSLSLPPNGLRYRDTCYGTPAPPLPLPLEGGWWLGEGSSVAYCCRKSHVCA